MPPTVILIRHAQALHNMTQNYSLHDPDLTDAGRSQCAQLREKLRGTLPGKLDVDLILVSPMRRTLQTTLLALDWLIEKGVPVQAHAGWQETTNHKCDVGSPISELEAAFPTVDFTHVDPIFPDKTSPAGSYYEWSRAALLRRAQDGLRELRARPEKVVAVVSHSGFLTKAVTGAAFFNADYRIFEFEEEPEEGDGNMYGDKGKGGKETEVYKLEESRETRDGHGGMGWSWDVVVPLGEGIPEVPPKE